MIYVDDFGEKKFKMDVFECNDCMEVLFNEIVFNIDEVLEFVCNFVVRYQDLGELFFKDFQGDVLLLFIYWVIWKVKLIEIIVYVDEDVYMIFEIMNDCGLLLILIDMLKGYFLVNIDNLEKWFEVDKLIKKFFG